LHVTSSLQSVRLVMLRTLSNKQFEKSLGLLSTRQKQQDGARIPVVTNVTHLARAQTRRSRGNGKQTQNKNIIGLTRTAAGVFRWVAFPIDDAQFEQSESPGQCLQLIIDWCNKLETVRIELDVRLCDAHRWY